MDLRLRRWLLCGMLALQACVLVYSAKIHSPTWDEVGHLAAGISHWKLGRFELYAVNPPLVRTIAAAPVVLFGSPEMDWGFYRSNPSLRSEVYLGRRMMQLSGERGLTYFFWARLAVIPFALLGTWLCFLWGASLFGEKAGWLAAFLWTVSPWTLAYGAIITPDLPAAVILLAVAFVAWRWLLDASWSNAFLLATTLAAAMLIKATWLILPAVVGCLWGAKLLSENLKKHEALPEAVGVSRRLQLSQLTAAMATALLLVNWFYGFQGSGSLLRDYTFVSRTLANEPDCVDCGQQTTNRFRSSALGYLPIPLPINYVQGIDIQRRDFERGVTEPAWKSYLLGQWQNGGWWYFYLVGLFVKTPLAFWILFGAAIVAGFFWRPDASTRLGVVCLLAPAVVLLLILSVNTGLNRYVRYALPIVPVLAIWASQLGRYLSLENKWISAAIATPCGCLLLVSLSSAPHWLSYFNPTVGGSENGHRILCDSNIDWGQDLLALKSWLADHPEAEGKLHLAASSSYDPACLGIEYSLPPFLPASDRGEAAYQANVAALEPGWYVISKNYLIGHSLPAPDGTNRILYKPLREPVFTYFQQMEPSGRIGHSMLVYHVQGGDTASSERETHVKPEPKTLARHETVKIDATALAIQEEHNGKQ